MESVAHGIGVKNRYALFYDEDLDPLEILRQQEEEKQKRKTEKTQCKDKGSKVTKSNKLPVTAPTQKKTENVSVKSSKASENTESVVKPKGKVPSDRFPRSYGNNQEPKDFEDRKNIRNKEDQFFSTEQKERDPEFRRGRGGLRGRGGGRGDRGRGFFGNSENRNRRTFDRHSGSDKTGVRSVDKREGAGSNNWGDIRSDINLRKDDAMWEEEFEAGGEKTRENTNWAEDENTEKKEEGTKTEFDNAESKENEPLPEEPTEEAAKEMTLDEWKKEQEAKRVVPKYNLRKPGEGEDDKQWKKFYMLKKKAKEEDDDQEDEEDDEDYNRKGNQRLLLDIQINFSDSRRGMRGRGRGGRGGPPRAGAGPAAGREAVREDRGNRGGRGGRESSKAKGQQSAPRVDDFNDFPSLVNA
jgi:plasminogen activator inhibitor 1 RNA-binding protein